MSFEQVNTSAFVCSDGFTGETNFIGELGL